MSIFFVGGFSGIRRLSMAIAVIVDNILIPSPFIIIFPTYKTPHVGQLLLSMTVEI